MKNRTRNIQIKFRLSEEEAEKLKEKIEKSGMSQQEYLLKCALNKNVTNTDSIKEIYPELKRQGNNLNQLVKRLNERGYVDYKKELPTMQKEWFEVWQLLRQFLQKQV